MRSDSKDTIRYRKLAQRYLAGGVMHHLSHVPELSALVISHAKGSRIWDTDGREYIDYYLGSAAIVLGHSHPKVMEAVFRQLPRGSQVYEMTPAALELAELVVNAVPCAERIKYAMSGTEAIGAALRLARAHTGRDCFLKFEGAYHGSTDWMLWGTRHNEPVAYPRATADSRGIPDVLGDYVFVAPYNDVDRASDLIQRHAARLSAVLVEPVLGNIPPRPGFLQAVRELTTDLDIPLIFDEIVTGFRLALGGAQDYYDVVPDLTCLGKSLGGGHAIGALVGREDLLQRFSSGSVARGEAVLHVGTFSGNPISCAAGQATVTELMRPGTYERLHQLGQQLADGLREISNRLGRPTYVVNCGPMVDLWFIDGEVESYPDTWRANRDLARRFKLGLLERGIWSPPGLKMFLSLAHSDDDIAKTLEAADASMRSL